MCGFLFDEKTQRCDKEIELNKGGVMIILSPSILSANFANLLEDIKKVEVAGAQWLHIDVMDGHFVPNISLGPAVIKSLRGQTNLLFDTHLMISEPEKYLADFANVGADLITIHAETTNDLAQCVKQIKDLGKKAGVSIKPETPVDVLREVMAQIDVVLIMSVNPGFAGQKFMPEALDKIKQAKILRDQINSNCLIEVDGGINLENAPQIIASGADVLVAASAIFCSQDPGLAVKQFLLI